MATIDVRDIGTWLEKIKPGGETMCEEGDKIRGLCQSVGWVLKV